MLHDKSQARIAILDMKEKYFFCPYTSLTQHTLLFSCISFDHDSAGALLLCWRGAAAAPASRAPSNVDHHETADYPSIHGTLTFILKRGSLSQHEHNHNEMYDGKKPHLCISEEQY
jgi:hypothetical protein